MSLKILDNILLSNILDENKCKVIDYLILIKLVIKNKFGYKIDFNNIFYQNIITYILPNFRTIFKINNDILSYIYYKYIFPINNTFVDICSFDNFVNKYNIKLNIKNSLCKLNNNKILKITTVYYKINIFNINFDIQNTCQIVFEIPFDSINKNFLQFRFKDFNKLMINLYNINGTLMYDYIIADSQLKLIYYEFFKKIIVKIFTINYQWQSN